MKNTINKAFFSRRIWIAFALAALACVFIVSTVVGQQQPRTMRSNYTVLNPITEGNLTLFPVVTESVHDTYMFLTLDEGIRSGQVVVTEQGASSGMVRPRPRERMGRDYQPPSGGAEVNRLMLTNNSDRALLLLAGEIVTGGKQDRVVGKDRIIAPKSGPVDLGVFCVEPHRWTDASAHFGGVQSFMAQPSVRKKAMADKDQGAVWEEVAKARMAVAAQTPAAAPMIAGTSSYAVTMQNRLVQDKVDSLAEPLERSYERLLGELRAQHAVGAVLAVDGQLVWSDVFASPVLLQAYWPKLVRSYAAEAVAARGPMKTYGPPSVKSAQMFLLDLNGRENVESEPGLYRHTELSGDSFEAFILTALLPGTGFDVHIAKMAN
jgi:hypothetical protein